MISPSLASLKWLKRDCRHVPRNEVKLFKSKQKPRFNLMREPRLLPTIPTCWLVFSASLTSRYRKSGTELEVKRESGLNSWLSFLSLRRYFRCRSYAPSSRRTKRMCSSFARASHHASASLASFSLNDDALRSIAAIASAYASMAVCLFSFKYVILAPQQPGIYPVTCPQSAQMVMFCHWLSNASLDMSAPLALIHSNSTSGF